MGGFPTLERGILPCKKHTSSVSLKHRNSTDHSRILGCLTQSKSITMCDIVRTYYPQILGHVSRTRLLTIHLWNILGVKY